MGLSHLLESTLPRVRRNLRNGREGRSGSFDGASSILIQVRERFEQWSAQFRIKHKV